MKTSRSQRRMRDSRKKFAEALIGDPDFTVEREGAIYLLTAQSRRARDWANANVQRVQSGSYRTGDKITVEAPWINRFIDGIRNDNLTIVNTEPQ